MVHDDVAQNLLEYPDDPNAKSHTLSEFYDNSCLNDLQGLLQSLYPEGVPSA
jgi:hypothetical protein